MGDATTSIREALSSSGSGAQDAYGGLRAECEKVIRFLKGSGEAPSLRVNAHQIIALLDRAEAAETRAVAAETERDRLRYGWNDLVRLQGMGDLNES
jgi:hypothetical protein